MRTYRLTALLIGCALVLMGCEDQKTKIEETQSDLQGIWRGTCRANGPDGEIEVIQFDETTYDHNLETYLAQVNCPGSPSTVDRAIGTFELGGRVDIAGEKATRMDIHEASGPTSDAKQIVLVTGIKVKADTLFFGDTSKTLDSDGYPTVLDTNFPYARQ